MECSDWGVRFLELGPGAKSVVDRSRLKTEVGSDVPIKECGFLNGPGDVHAAGPLAVR